MFITASYECNNNGNLNEENTSDFIEATKIDHHPENEFFEFYKKYLQTTEDHFNSADSRHSSFQDCKKEFMNMQEKLVKSLKNVDKADEYILCQELECPVCLTEMLPPTKIWTCRSGHTICQSCKRNPNMGRKCPTCRQEIIGRATGLEKIVNGLYKKFTGEEAPTAAEDEHETIDDDNERGSPIDESILEMIFLPNLSSSRNRPSLSFDIEMERLFANLSLIQGSRPEQ